MILYLDTSSLVKLYIAEKLSERVNLLVEGARIVSTSRIAYVEARAALARKFREHGLSMTEYRNVIQEVDQEWDTYLIVEVTESLVKLAALLAEKHALRGLDAIHLASAVEVHKRTGRSVTFSCFDDRLRSSAQKEDLGVAG